MAEDVVKLLSRPGSLMILVFDSIADSQFLWKPLQLVHKIHGGGKNLRFSTEIAVYAGNGTSKAHGCHGTLIGRRRLRIDTCRKSYAVYRMVPL